MKRKEVSNMNQAVSKKRSGYAGFPGKTRLLRLLISVVIYVLLIGLSFIILYPFLVKFTSIFMSQQDVADKTVQLIPRNPTLSNFWNVMTQTGYFTALRNTALLALTVSILQTFFSAVMGYGFSAFKFRGNGAVFALVVFTLIIPPQTLSTAYYMVFKDFDILGLFRLISGSSVRMLDTFVPMILLSVTGLGFKNGLYIFMMRQFFKGVPKELQEAADVDGAGVFKTFFQVMLPQARSMMLAIFLFSFAWQWTDDYYTRFFYVNKPFLNSVIGNAGGISINGHPLAAGTVMSSIMLNTAAFLVIIPLLMIYIVAQKRFVQGIESSGIVG